MDFELDDDQRELQDTVRGIVDKECSPSFVRSVIDDGIDPSGWWATMVELYWPALAIAEDHGGLGMGWIELVDPARGARAGDRSVAVRRHDHSVRADDRPLRRRRATGAVARQALPPDRSPVRSRSVPTPSPRRPPTAGGASNGSVRHVVDGDRADEIAVVATVMDDNGDGHRRCSSSSGRSPG